MACQERTRPQIETCQNLGGVCPQDESKVLKALESLRAGLAKGYKQVRPRLRALKKKAEAGDVTAYRLLLQAAVAPESLTQNALMIDDVRRAALDYIFGGDYTALGNPVSQVVAILQGARPTSRDAIELAVRVLCEMETSPDERAYLIGRVISGIETCEQETGKIICLHTNRHDYVDDLLRLKDEQGDLYPIFIHILKSQDYAPCSYENMRLLRRFKEDGDFQDRLTEEQAEWLRRRLAWLLEHGRKLTIMPPDERSWKEFSSLASDLINRIDARGFDDEAYLRDFYLAGRGDSRRARQAVHSTFSRNFLAGLALYGDSDESHQARLNRLVLEEAVLQTSENPQLLDESCLPAYFNVLRRAVWSGEGALVVRGYAACLRSPAVNEEQRMEMFIRLRAMERDGDKKGIGRQYAAYRLLEKYGQLPLRMDYDAFRQSLAAAPAMVEDVAPDEVPRGALVRMRVDGGIYIALGKAGIDFSASASYGRSYFRRVMDGSGSYNTPLNGTGWARSSETFDILLDDNRNKQRVDEGVHQWGDAAAGIDDLMEAHRKGDRSGDLAERLSAAIRRRCGKNLDLIVTTASGQRRYPLKYYRATTVNNEGEILILLECQAPDGDDAIFSLDETERVSLEREPVLIPAEERPLDDVDEEVYTRLVRAGLRPPAEIVNQRPDLVLKYGV